jgi:uncharacterized protein YgbK (DUF1537 family)
MILGVIADDFTGATDVASMLVRSGMRTVQSIGVPAGPAPDADACVVALKSRTAPVHEAVEASLQALRWLQKAGARQFYFKYCSTFDSTPKGNIGPVADALLQALGSDFTIACPALPDNGRTVYQGHLFVGGQLLSESGMRDHPLTPMTDACLPRVLQAQVQGRVGLAAHAAVSQGVDALRGCLSALRAEGCRYAVVDAVDNGALHTIAAACQELPLITAGSGVALGLPAVYAARGWITPDQTASHLPAVGGAQAVLAGSCSQATRAQVARWRAQGRPAFQIDPLALARGDDVAGQALAAWHADPRQPHLFYATAEPEAVRQAQHALGAQQAGAQVESCLARIAQGLVAAGVRRLVVAGGETSGAVVQALGVQQLRIGPSIAPGVPWTQVHGRELLLALKSGNFGSEDFFAQALAMSA